MKKSKVSIVAPVFNEQECLEPFYEQVKAAALEIPRFDVEIVFVNDGSSDRSPEILSRIQQKDPAVKVLNFSRNFGHQAAIKSGLDHADGDAVIILDADLQDPPAYIPAFVQKWQENYDVVYAVRESRKGEGFLKKMTASLYYRLMKYLAHIDIPLDAGDFRLMSRRVVDVLRKFPERNLYLRGLTSWIGFKQTGILIARAPRFAGSTKYSWRKMIHLAWNGVTHFSFLPLQVATYLGVATSVLCLLWLSYALYVAVVLKIAVAGWTSLMIAVLFLGSLQLITLGILGSYVARNYDEARSRPLYIIESKQGF